MRRFERKTRAVDPLDAADRDELRRRTRRGFAAMAASVAAGIAGWRWFLNAPPDAWISGSLRWSLGLHERLGRATFRAASRSPEWPIGEAKMPIVNGMIGIQDPAEIAWSLRVTGAGGEAGAKTFSLDQLKALDLPRVEIITELKCVEGWSTPVRWGGVRLVDLAARIGLASRSGRLGPPTDPFSFAGLETPDRRYYVGLDIESALHEQTLLCDEMDGQPIAHRHGAPLRLYVPVKYGYKSLKQVGLIRFTDRRPADFWEREGFDWYAGL